MIKLCRDCKYMACCIMAAPDGGWAPCDEFEPK